MSVAGRLVNIYIHRYFSLYHNEYRASDYLLIKFVPNLIIAILGRSVSNVATFAVMGWAGLDALAYHGGWASHALPFASKARQESNSFWSAATGQGIVSLITNDSESVRLVGYGSSARVYLFSGRSQRLCVLQLCFQAKNFIDTIVHGDGIIFAFHHVATGALAYFALAPYLHLYAPFFFGISEISTLFIAILVNFDEQQGIKVSPNI